MANVSRIQGFLPLKHTNGSAWNGQSQMYLCDSGDSTRIARGDLVIHAGGAGAAGVVVSGQDVEGMPTITKAVAQTTGQDIVGVVVGFLPDPTTNLGVTNTYRVASTSRIALVITDPTVVYEIEEDAVSTPIAAASIGLLAAYNSTNCSTTTGNSAETIISSTVASTSTLPLKIIGLVKRPNNALNTAGAGTDPGKFEVTLNTTWYATNAPGKA